MDEHGRLVAHDVVELQVIEKIGAQIGRNQRDGADAERLPQRLSDYVRDALQFAGADFMRDHRIDRHHHAHHGDDHNRPNRRPQRHGGQIGSADMPGHGDIGHAHAHRCQLTDQHRPGQLPEEREFPLGSPRCGFWETTA